MLIRFFTARLSVCLLSVRPSVTRWHYVNMTHATIMGSLPKIAP